MRAEELERLYHKAKILAAAPGDPGGVFSREMMYLTGATIKQLSKGLETAPRDVEKLKDKELYCVSERGIILVE